MLRAAGLPDEVLAELLTPVEFVAVTTSGEPVSEADVTASFILPYAFTLIFMLSIFITSGYLLQSVTEEKENRVVEIILSSIPALPLMAGKVLGLGAAGLTQVAIWLATALVALPLANQQFSINLGVPVTTLVLAIVFFTLGYLSYGAIFAAIGALAPGAREGQQYGSFFGFIAVIPLDLHVGLPDRPIVADRHPAVPAATDRTGGNARGAGAGTDAAVAAGRGLARRPGRVRDRGDRRVGADLPRDGVALRRASWSAPHRGRGLRALAGAPRPGQASGFHSSIVARAESLSLNQRASSSVYCAHSAGSESSGKIALTGHSGSHAPQSMHSSGSM